MFSSFFEIITSYKVEEMEFYLLLFVVVVSFAVPNLADARFKIWEQDFTRLARRRAWAVVAVGALAILVRTAALPILPVPVPSIDDEYENLLMADTFAHGRITNPPHPMRAHLETFHVLQEPTYTGIVPPAQGLMLAVGQRLTGYPFAGVVLSLGIMCAAICWMLQGWLPPNWALLGGILAVLRFGIFNYWANSYWGGAVAAAAGALVLGAIPRIFKRQRILDVVLLGVGLALLANSRPYEGFILGLPLAAAMVVWLMKGRTTYLQAAAKHTVFPLLLLLCITAGAMGYYNWRVTGSALRSPYAVSMATVNPVPYFPWQALRPIPTYHFKEMKEFYLDWDLQQYRKLQTFSGWIDAIKSKSLRLSRFYFGAALAFPLVMAVLLGGFRSIFLGRLRLLSICVVVCLAGLLVEVQYFPHYAAPVTAAFLALIVQAMRYVYACGRRGQSRFLLAVRLVPVLCLLSLVFGEAQQSQGYDLVTDWPHSWYSSLMGNTQRAEIQKWLEHDPGQHLVIVRYSPNHYVHEEWVYNSSDIDHAKVVWARDIDPEQNQELIDYFQNRKVWLVEPDIKRYRIVQLLPYTPGAALSAMQTRPDLSPAR